MDITILYGTESGNSELIAQDLADKLNTEGHIAEVFDMQDFDPADLTPKNLYLVVCSTHGEGDLPNTAQPFFNKLSEFRGDLTGLKYAMFGLGDTFYEETYSQGSEHIDRRLTDLGATRIGDYGRHDASSWDLPSDVALEWLPGVLSSVG